MCKKIVDGNLKIDLHIHSIHSKHKEGKDYEILFNTKDKLHILREKLEINNVNIAAITDHNAFSYEMYGAFIEETKESDAIKKVLPGVELDVLHKGIHIHVVCIFDDADHEKLKNLEKFLEDNNKEIYNESDLHSLFSHVKSSVLLIPHQKDRIEKPRERDLSNVGLEEFTDSISYFDAIEFKSYKVEPYLRSFQHEHLCYFSMITGTDCHNWSLYPKIDSKTEESIAIDTYVRALPTFRGLVMALTEPSRLSPSYREYNNGMISSINFDILDEPIELSGRINVIIGDNSIGKSAILHKLTSYKNIQDAKEGTKALSEIYEEFLETTLGFSDTIDETTLKITKFEAQGTIRKLFQNSKSLVENEIVKKYFNSFDYDSATARIMKYASDYFDAIVYRDEVAKKLEALKATRVLIPDTISSNYFPTLKKLYTGDENASKSRLTAIKRIIKKLEDAKKGLEEARDIEKNGTLKIHFADAITKISGILNIYYSSKLKHKQELDIYNLLGETISKIQDKISKSQSDNDILADRFNTQVEDFTNRTLEYTMKISNEVSFSFDHEFEFDGNPNAFGNFKFINQPARLKYGKSDLERILSYGFINKNKAIDSQSDSLEDLKIKIGYEISKTVKFKDFYLSKVKKKLYENELKHNVDILYKEKSKSGNKSAGSNALMYLDLLSQDNDNKLILLDQPEDDVSQGKINSDLIDIIRSIALDRQVIIITHNPQLVVNLDVDNVICLKYNDDDKIIINSGALEYFNDKYDILKDVAQILDGGTESIMRRWKVYDKTN